MDLSAKAAKIRKGPKRKSKLHNYYTTGDRFLLAFFTLVLVFAFIAVLYPLIYALISSFNKGMLPLSLIPNRITLAGYEVCLQYGYLWKGFLNSVIYMIVGTALALLVTICCAYPMSLPLRLGGVMAVICMFTCILTAAWCPPICG